MHCQHGIINHSFIFRDKRRPLVCGWIEVPFLEQLYECINFLLTVSQHAVFQNLHERLDPFGITPGQYAVLYCLWNKGEITPKEISQSIFLEMSTVSGVLDRMQKKGLIQRVVDPNDRRSVRVAATPEGMALREGVMEAVAAMNTDVLGEFTPEEVQLLRKCLARIGNVSSLTEKE